MKNAEYTKILQGKGINDLVHTSKGQLASRVDGSGNYKTLRGTEIILREMDKCNLDATTHKILDALLTKLTLVLPYGKKIPLEKIDSSRLVMISVSEFMEMCGLKDHKNARKTLIDAARTLYNLSIIFDEKIKGEIIHWDMRILDAQGIGSKSDSPIIDGRLYVKFTMDVAKYLSGAYIMPYPKNLFRIRPKKNPHSFYLERKFLEHYNMNIGRPNAERITVKKLLEGLPDMPSYDEVMRSDKGLSKRIINPFERDMNALKDHDILESWEYCNANGKELTQEQLDRYDYYSWVEWRVKFKLANYPDQTERLERKSKKIKAAEKKKKEKEGLASQ